MQTFAQALAARQKTKALTFDEALRQIQKRDNAPQEALLQVAFEPVRNVDGDKRQVFGWFSVTEVDGEALVDHHGAVIESEALEKGVYDYVLRSRLAGDQHQRLGVGYLIESMFFSKEKQEALGIDLGRIGWWGGLLITDDQTWDHIKKGERLMFSWGGLALKEEIEDDGQEES